jgi:EpsI family protein
VDGAPRDVNYFVLKNGKATDVVYYWYQGRGRVVASEYRVKWNLLRDAALLGHTEEALVRIVIPVRVPNAATAASPDAKSAFAATDSLGDSVAARLIREVTRALPGRAG